MNRRTLLSIGLPLWGIALLYWTHYVNTYANAAADIDCQTSHWPAASRLPRHRQLPTLIMFLHPSCFCSRASLWELEELVSRYPQRVSVTLVMVSDAAHAAEWRDTALQKQARELQDVAIIQDKDSWEASLFRAGTSGETFVFSPAGTLLFQGGMTAARGHMGDAPGQDAIAKLLQQHCHTGRDNATRCNVFGCRLTQHADSQP